MVATSDRWFKGTDGRTRFHGQPRRGRMTDADLTTMDSRLVRHAITRAEEALLAHLETHPKSVELVEALAQLDLAVRFVGDIESRPHVARPAKARLDPRVR